MHVRGLSSKSDLAELVDGVRDRLVSAAGLVLSEVTLAIETTDGVRIITDNRVDSTAADPTVVSHSLTGEIPLRVIHRVILLTDGAARAVSPFKLYDWPGIFSVVTDEGPSELIRRVRIAENADPAGKLHPRNKVYDDTTVVILSLKSPRLSGGRGNRRSHPTCRLRK